MAAKLINLRNNQNGVSEIIAIIILVAVTIILVAVLNLYLGNENQAALQKAPIVSMTQTQEKMFIIEVQNGPVNVTRLTVQAVNENKTIASNVNHVIHSKDTELKGSDTIEFTGMMPGKTYEIRLIYEGNIVGLAKYYNS